MSLIDRLAGIGTNEGGKLPVDDFWAMLYELASGKVTKAQIVAHFALDADDLLVVLRRDRTAQRHHTRFDRVNHPQRLERPCAGRAAGVVWLKASQACQPPVRL